MVFYPNCFFVFILDQQFKVAGFMLSEDKKFYEKLSKKELSDQEAFDARQNIVGFFDLLYQVDKRLTEEKKDNKKNDKAVCSAGST